VEPVTAPRTADGMWAMIANRASVDEMRASAIQGGFRTMPFEALQLWLAGGTTTRKSIRVNRA
jgi:type II secretory ATPase GspE/PulE/Tfp pilus assembly ATPase PilB-like protein